MATEGYARPELLVDAAWVDGHKGDADVVIVDCEVEQHAGECPRFAVVVRAHQFHLAKGADVHLASAGTDEQQLAVAPPSQRRPAVVVIRAQADDPDAVHLGQVPGCFRTNVRGERGTEAKRGRLAQHAAAGEGTRLHVGDGSVVLQGGQAGHAEFVEY